MKYQKINGHDFYNMVVNASNRLLEESDFVNALNVFPVPDGDTGTNMSMTFKAAVKEIENMNSNSIGEISKKLAKGALMGARGNSGVILSQILRGISCFSWIYSIVFGINIKFKIKTRHINRLNSSKFCFSFFL